MIYLLTFAVALCVVGAFVSVATAPVAAAWFVVGAGALGSMLVRVPDWRRRARARARAADAAVLWPAIYEGARGDFARFIEAATSHMVIDPAWFGHDAEWQGTEVTPWAWYAAHAGVEKESP